MISSPMPSLSVIETRLREHANGQVYDEYTLELILYELMHTGHRTGQPVKAIVDRVHAHVNEWLSDNALPMSFWQCVCFSWVLRDLIWKEPDPQLTDYQHQLNEQIVQQGQVALQTYQTGLLDGSALYLNYLIEQTQFSADSRFSELAQVAVHQIVERQVEPLLNGRNAVSTDLSLYSGLTGLLLTLLRFAEANGLSVAIQKQLHGFVHAVAHLAQPVDYLLDRYSFFPVRVRLDTQEYEMNNSMSWATGDLGVVLLLYRAARYFNDARLHKIADSIGTFTLIRDDVQTTQVDSPCLLHGSIGTAAMYGTLYEISGNARYPKGQQYWTEQTIQWLTSSDKLQTESVGSLLHGYAGILLSLRTFDHQCRSDWKRLFLL